MAAASAVRMTKITHLDMGKDFAEKFVAFETASRYVPPSSDYYTLPSSSQTLFGFYGKGQSNYSIRILPLLKSTAKDTSVEVFVDKAPEGKITTLFLMKIATNKECTEILSAIKSGAAKIAYCRKDWIIQDLTQQMS